MNRYYDRLPRYVYIKNEKFIINTDYRIFVKFEEQMQDINTKKAIYDALSSFYPAFSQICKNNMLNEAIDQFIWFYKCGKIDKNKKSSNNSKNQQQVFSYDYDANLIYGAFLIYARIDLNKYLHWWKFKAIWSSLPSDCEFNKIKSYRAYNGKDKDILELKEAYKLPLTEKEIKKEIQANQIYEALK